jgi:hypothetical protein
MMLGGLVNDIPLNRLGEARSKDSIPPQAKELVEYLCFKKSEFIEKNYYNIYGSFMYRLQNYPSDIDSTNILKINLDDEESAKIIELHLQSNAKKLSNNKSGRTYADCKCGRYDNGEPIHWKIHEIIQGYRDIGIPDINSQYSNKQITLYDAIMDKGSLMKMDMLAPYMGRYVEVSCLYQIQTNDGFITHTHLTTPPEKFLIDLSQDTTKQYKKGKIFKTVKRIFSNARIRNDTKTLKTLKPLIDSNLSRLASMKADISTLLLLLSVNKYPAPVVLKQQFSKLKFGLDNILDIKLPLDELYKLLDQTYLLLSKKIPQSVLLLEKIENILDKIINDETLKYFNSIGINNIPQYFGHRYMTTKIKTGKGIGDSFFAGVAEPFRQLRKINPIFDFGVGTIADKLNIPTFMDVVNK